MNFEDQKIFEDQRANWFFTHAVKHRPILIQFSKLKKHRCATTVSRPCHPISPSLIANVQEYMQCYGYTSKAHKFIYSLYHSTIDIKFIAKNLARKLRGKYRPDSK